MTILQIYKIGLIYPNVLEFIELIGYQNSYIYTNCMSIRFYNKMILQHRYRNHINLMKLIFQIYD